LKARMRLPISEAYSLSRTVLQLSRNGDQIIAFDKGAGASH